MNIEVMNAYNDFTFDLFISTGDMDRSTEQIVKSMPGVAGTYGIFGSYNDVELKGTGKMIGFIQGIEPCQHHFNARFRR